MKIGSKPIILQAFSGPWEANGYGDRMMMSDLISDVFLSFNDQTRAEESAEYLRTLEGQFGGLHLPYIATHQTAFTSHMYLNG